MLDWLGRRVWRVSDQGQWSPGWWLDDLPRSADLITADPQGRVYVAESRAVGSSPDWLKVHAYSAGGQYLGVVTDEKPNGDWSMAVHSLASAPVRDRVYVGRCCPSHFTVHDPSGRRLSHVYNPIPWLEAAPDWIAPHADRGTAVRAQFGVELTQYLADGTPYSQVRFRPAGLGLGDRWFRARMATDGLGLVHILLADDQFVATVDDQGKPVRFLRTASWPRDVAAGRDGSVVVKSSGGQQGSVAAWDSDGGVAWEAVCECEETDAVAMWGERPVVGDAIRGRLYGYRAGGQEAVEEITAGPQGDFWPADLAVGGPGDGYLYTLNTREGAVDVWADSAQPARWAWMEVGRGVQRISADRTGAVAALTVRGELRLFSAAGELTNSARLGDVLGELAVARDVALSPDGGVVYVLYTLSDQSGDVARIARLEPHPAGAVGPPTRPVEGPGACQVSGDHTAIPDSLALGEAVTVTIHVSIACPQAADPLIDLVLMPTGLGGGFNGYIPYGVSNTQALALKRLIRGIDLERHRVGLLHFGHRALVLLGGSREALMAAADDLRELSTDFGFKEAAYHLKTAGRPGTRKVIVYTLYDHPDPVVLAEAEAAKRDGVQVVVLAWVDVRPPVQPIERQDVPVYVSIASSEADIFFFYHRQSESVLWERIAGPQRREWARNASVRSVLSADVDYVPGTASRGGGLHLGAVAWDLGGLPAQEVAFRYVIRPRRVGRYAIAEEAYVDYTEPRGTRHRLRLPIPEVEVRAAEATPTAWPQATPTAESGSGQAAYLPLAWGAGPDAPE